MYKSFIKKQKHRTRGIVKGLLNSIISKYFKMNLRWLEDQKLNCAQMSTLIKFFYDYEIFLNTLLDSIP